MTVLKHKKILLFPYSGGTKSCYRNLSSFFGKHIISKTIDFRLGNYHSFISTIKNLEKIVQEEMSDEVELILFGHSLGAYLAFEVSMLPSLKGKISKLVISGAVPPNDIKEFIFLTSKMTAQMLLANRMFPNKTSLRGYRF